MLKAEAPAPTPAPTSAEPLAPEELFELTGAFETFIPPAFYQVFHLARVIFSWGRVLEAGSRGALQAVAGPGGDRVQQEAPRGLASGVPVLGGYTVNPRVRRIRSFDEIGLVDASTLATHDLDRLVREAEERELWVRVPERAGVERLAEEIASVRDGGSQDALNDSEQKLYLLVDKSVSMRTAHRHVYAKALALYFLREKLRHGRNPMLFYRGFAAEITPLIRATRKRDIPQVVRELLLADPDSKGTDLQAALLTAIRDINTASLMRDAQILVITDGLGIIDAEAIRREAGDSIRIHMVIVGTDVLEPTEAEMRDLAERFHLPVTLKEELKRLFLDQVNQQFRAITDTLLELPDVRDEDLQVPPEEMQRLTGLAQARVLGVDPGGEAAEEAHKLAVFLGHSLDFLRPHAQGPTLAELDSLHQRLNAWITRRLQRDGALRELLAKRNVNLMLEKSFLEAAKGDKAIDAALLAGEGDLGLALKLWGRREGGGGGFSIPWWLLAKMLLRKWFVR